MIKPYIPTYLYKDLPLRISAFITCSVLCYVCLSSLNFGIEFLLKLSAFVTFYLAFFIVTATPPSNSPPRNKFLLLYQLFIALSLIKYDSNYTAATLIVFIATQLPIRFSRIQAFLIILSTSAAHYAIVFDDPLEYGFNSVIIYLMLQFFGYFAVDSLLREEITKEALSSINKELMATRYMLKTASEQKERLRISRDLHDVVGHQLTSLALNLEVSHHKVPEEYKPLLKGNLEQAKSTLSDMRNVVKEMRNAEQFDLKTRFSSLFAHLPNCELTLESIEDIHDLFLKQQIMYCLQEGVSNAIRHGKATHFTLSASRQEKQLTFLLKDDGNSQSTNTFGSGLKGMQERVADFQGKVELIHHKTGCTLKIQVTDLA